MTHTEGKVQYILIEENHGLNTERAEWPIIVAVDGEEVAGFIGTGYPNGIWVMGHLWARSGIIALRLVEHYDMLANYLGVKEYFFNVDKTNERWIAQIERLGFVQHSADEDTIWYKRCLNQKPQSLH